MYSKKLLFYLVLAFLLQGLRAGAVQLSGSYTINPAQAPSATNFRNFESAIAYLTGIGLRSDTTGMDNTAPFGVNGPVTFFVAAGTYPVSQPVSIPAIPGASAANRVTFSGAGQASTIISGFLPEPLVKLNQCTHVTISDIGITNLSVNSGIGVAIIGSTTANTGSSCSVIRCRVEASRYGINVTSDTSGIEVNWFCRADSITIDSNTIHGPSTGIMFRGNQQAAAGTVYNNNLRIRANTLENITQYGIRVHNTGGTVLVRNNTIRMGSVSFMGMIGIDIASWWNSNPVASNEVYGNKISGRYQSGIVARNGSSLSAFPTRIINNLVTGPWDAIGIYLPDQEDGQHYEVYHNTVYSHNELTQVAAALIHSTSHGSIRLVNNILAGKLLNTVVDINAADTQVYINHNTYYTGNIPGIAITRNNTVYYSNTFQVPQAGGDSSRFALPGLTNEGRLLHGCDLAGQDLLASVPLDLDRNPRSATPTAGCYEYQALPTNLELVKIIHPTVPIVTGIQNIEILVRNIGSAPVTSFYANFQLNGNAPVVEPYNSVLGPCDTATIRFSSQAYFDSANVLTVYLSDPNAGLDLDPHNDTIRTSIVQPASGGYSIGITGADFRDFASAFDHLVRSGVSGPVVFTVAPGIYSAPLALSYAIPGASQTNSITFEGTNRGTCIIEGVTSGGPLVLLSSSYIHFRNLTINCQGGPGSSAVKISGRDLSHISIKHCTINMYDLAGQPSTDGTIIDKGGVVNDVTIDSNTLNFGGKAVYFYPSATSKWCFIRGNEINRAYTSGISMWQHSGIEIRNNRITMDNVQPMPDLMAEGITLYACEAQSVDDNIEITGNVILHSIQAGIKLMGCFNPTYKRGLVYNNVIAGGHQDAYSAGFLVAALQGFDIDHNSVRMNKMAIGSAIDFDYLGGSDTRIRNNHFTFANGLNGYVAAFWDLSVISALDHNNYYREDTISPDLILMDYMGYNATSFRGVSGYNVNSRVVDPLFVNDTVLVAKRACLTGDTLGIATDVVGVTRKSPPDIGAYEVVLPANDAGITAIVSPAFPVDSGAQDLVVQLRNFGSLLSSATVTYELNGGPPVTTGWNGMLNDCDSNTALVTFTGTDQVNIIPGVPNIIKVYTQFPNGTSDAVHENDTFTQLLITPLNGPYSIGGSGADYASFTEASSALDLRGISGPVTFNVKADTVYVEDQLIIHSFPGNGQYPVTFQRTGAGANPAICGMNGTGGFDAIVKIAGADGVHFNGIDVFDSSLVNNNILQMEYGFLIVNGSVSDGASGNSIANSTIRLKWNIATASGNGIAILQSSSASDGNAFNAATLSGANHNNRYENIRTENCFQGIILVADRFFPDSNNVITSSGSDTSVIGGTPGRPMGGSQYGVYGILAYCQSNIEISNCVIRDIRSPRTTGIAVLNRLSGSPSMGNAIIRNNIVYNLHGDASGGASGIQVTLKATDMVTATNNVVHGLSCDNPAAPSSTMLLTGIGHCMLSGEGPGTYLNNSVSVDAGASLNATATAFWKGGTGTAVLANNALVNTTGAQTGDAGHYALYLFYGSVEGSSNNLLWADGTNGALVYNLTQPVSGISEWATIMNDRTSLAYLPDLHTLPHLRPNPAAPGSWALNGRGIHTDSTVMRTDITGTSRPLTRWSGVPDIGAYEFTPAAAAPLCQAVPASLPAMLAHDTIQTFLFGGDTVATIFWPAGLSIPASASLRLYTGERPPYTTQGTDHMYSYLQVELSNESYYNYGLDLYYQPEWLGTIPVANDIRMTAKTGMMPWSVTSASITDTVASIITAWPLSDLSSLYSGTNMYNPMPVQLLSFTAVKQQNDAVLGWKTAAEANSSHFVVERSVDGRHFTSLHEEKAAGNTSATTRYSYTDRNARKNGIVYYRLRIVDLDGSYTYSNIASISWTEPGTQANAPAYPNPFASDLYVPVKAGQGAAVTVSLTDLTGKTLIKQTHEAGSSLIALEGKSLAPGIYFVVTECNGIRHVQKVIKE